MMLLMRGGLLVMAPLVDALSGRRVRWFSWVAFLLSLGALFVAFGKDLRWVDVRQDACDAYNAGLQRRMKHMVWSSGCKSWYLSADGRNHSLYPGPAAEYAARALDFRNAEYEVAV